MTRSLRVRRRAEDQIQRAVDWYDRQRPEMFPVVYRTARRALLNRFPYAVYFLLTDDLIVVIAFFHGRQNRETELARLT